MSGDALHTILRRDRLVVAACLAAICLLAWLFLFHLAGQMQAMDGGAAPMMGMPAEDGMSRLAATATSPEATALANATIGFSLIALMWAVMMIGMMAPSAAPTILLFAALERKRAAGGVRGRSAAFVAGYFAVWGAFAVVAAAAQTILAHSGLLSMQMAATSTLLAGGIFVAAGVYEFSPLKERCLTHCRSPLDWIPRHMRAGRLGAVRMGVEHGAYCVGCCWALMVLLFAGGVMNLVWVAVIAGFILVQKLAPGGRVLARLGAAALVLAGAVLMVRPLLSM